MTRVSRPRSIARRPRTLVAALAAGGALAAVAGPASALPLNPLIPNIPPIASFSAAPNPVLVPTNSPVGAPVTFNAGASRDVDGSIVRYEWDLDGVPGFERTTVGSSVSRRYTDRGDITVRVRVVDNRGATSVASRTLVRHTAPVPRITASRSVTVVGEGIAFTGAGSTDDRGIARYDWDLDGDGTYERSGIQASTSYGTVGTRTVRLRVVDTHGVSTVATQQVRVHRAPTAVIVTQPPSPITGQPVTFDGSNSSDDGTIARYEWDLDGNGTFETDTAAVPTATTTFATAGPARVGLRVTDGDGATDATTLQFAVADTPPPPDTTAPRISPASKRLKMTRDGRVNVRLACPASEQMCRVSVSLRGAARPLAGRPLGSATRTIPGGGALTATVRLSPAARRAIVRRPLRATAVVTAVDAAGNRGVTRTAVTIRR